MRQNKVRIKYSNIKGNVQVALDYGHQLYLYKLFSCFSYKCDNKIKSIRLNQNFLQDSFTKHSNLKKIL